MALGVTQAFLSSLTCVVVYRIARGLSGMAAGTLSGLAMALYPVFIIQAARPFSLTVNTLLLALLLWLLLDLRHRSNPAAWVAAGVALGLLTLSRSSILGFLVGILGWLWLNRKSIPKWHQAAAVIVVSTLFTLLPWALHNHYALGQPSPLSTCGGFTFWNGNNPFTTGNVFDVYVGKVRAYLGTDVVVEAAEEAIMDLRPYPLPHEVAPYIHRLSEVELDRALYQAGWRFIQENPGQWLALGKTKLMSLWWFRPNLGRSRADLGEHGLVYDSRWIMPYKLLYAALFPLFLAGMVLSFSRWRIYSLFYVLFLYLTVVYVAFHVMTRFRWEIEPYILLFVIVAILDIGQRILSRFGRGPLALPIPSSSSK
jgi:4-amino-4-deoxy-L-arabinose transferase-like glycosyltransferase